MNSIERYENQHINNDVEKDGWTSKKFLKRDRANVLAHRLNKKLDNRRKNKQARKARRKQC